MVSDCLLNSILSISVKALELLCAEAADALALHAGDLTPDAFLSSLNLMCIFKKLNLS